PIYLDFYSFCLSLRYRFSEEDLVPVKQLYSLPLKIKRVGHNKLIAEVKWDGALERDDEPVKTKF
ncbi:hypothetical protein RhiirB3_421151, partial [Rhizophagus irregularis]